MIAQGNGVTKVFQLIKTYSSGPGSYGRPISKPVKDTVRAGIGGNEVYPGAHYAVDHARGLITFAEAPQPGAQVFAELFGTDGTAGDLAGYIST